MNCAWRAKALFKLPFSSPPRLLCFNLSICDVLLQASVGTVVRTGEDEDPIAVMTVLNTQQHKQAGFMQQIRQYVLGKCKDAALKDKLAKVRLQQQQQIAVQLCVALCFSGVTAAEPQLAAGAMTANCSAGYAT